MTIPSKGLSARFLASGFFGFIFKTNSYVHCNVQGTTPRSPRLLRGTTELLHIRNYFLNPRFQIKSNSYSKQIKMTFINLNDKMHNNRSQVMYYVLYFNTFRLCLKLRSIDDCFKFK